MSVTDYAHPTAFEDISFHIHQGEILGFYGLVGAGRSEVMQCLFGLSKAKSGQLAINQQPVRIVSPKAAIQHGIAYVPEDRGQQGIIRDLPIYQMLPYLHWRNLKGAFSICTMNCSCPAHMPNVWTYAQ